ncbi:MAG: peptidoglycan DD-metalloendopeptidase family protein [Syntrophobacteraceae bacterium]
MAELIFPLRKRPADDYHTGGRQFRASRAGGLRKHAACDLIAPYGTDILAMADGKIVRGPYPFYSGTYALEVQHDNGMVVRYGEISQLVPPAVTIGAKVSQSQVIAHVGRLESGSSMLHLEMYAGTADGPLTRDGNEFMRRCDLVDPTGCLDAAPLTDAQEQGQQKDGVEGLVNHRLTSKLQVRSQASVSSPVIVELAPMTVFKVLEEVSGEPYDWGRTDWCKIEYNGQQGFAAAYYVDVNNEPTPFSHWDQALLIVLTTGASSVTAKQDGLAPGVQASRSMAETDLPRVKAIADRFCTASAKCGVPAAVLAAIASRESRCGKSLKSGWGDSENAFGIMQVDKRAHQPEGLHDPASLEHIEQAAGIFAKNLGDIQNEHPDWEDPFILKGAAVAYNAGPSTVKTKDGMDIGTTGNDYGSDVMARAQYYASHSELGIFRGSSPARQIEQYRTPAKPGAESSSTTNVTTGNYEKGGKTMDWKELGENVVKLGAPLLGTVMGGPAGGVVGGLVAQLFGADPAKPDDIMSKMNSDPQATTKLQDLQTKHQEGLDELNAYLADTHDARQREIDIVKATGKKDTNLYVLAWVIVAGFFVLTGILMFFGVKDPSSNAVVNLLFGGLVSGFATVLGYFFGSSKGSAEKNALLAAGK